jgi:hypothetical protein
VIVGDECWFADQVPENLKAAAEQKCATNPTFGTLEEVTARLQLPQ